MGSTDRDTYEQEKAPLHPWIERMDDRTGYAWCEECVSRTLPWGQNKSLHPDTEIFEFTW